MCGKSVKLLVLTGPKYNVCCWYSRSTNGFCRAMISIGVDLGGTKIEAAALDASGAVLEVERVATPQGQYDATIGAIANLVAQLESRVGRATIGIGLPGSISPHSGLIRNANSTCLNGHPLQQDIEARLQRPVAISNDANCFALSEATDGAAAGAQSVFGVIIGTGTGAGVVINGEVINGHNGNAGEWGHNPLPWPAPDEYPGPACWCGLQGCIETWLSGPGFAKDFQTLTRQPGESSITAQEIVALAEQGDTEAEMALARYESRLARALAHVINMLDPEIIVLGGGMSNIQRLYGNVPELWSQFVFSDRVTTQLLPPKFGDSSGVRGAAWLGAQNENID